MTLYCTARRPVGGRVEWPLRSWARRVFRGWLEGRPRTEVLVGVDSMLLQSGSERAAAATLAEAFMEDPLFCAVEPDSSRRLAAMPRITRMQIDASLLVGRVHCTEGVTAVAAWEGPRSDVGRLDELRAWLLLPASLRSLRPAEVGRLVTIMTRLDRARAELAGPDCVTLAMVGVRRELQGRGLGVKVIRPGLEFADARHLTAYLETENQRNVRLYERLGFRIAQFVAATDFPLDVDVWRMVRPPD